MIPNQSVSHIAAVGWCCQRIPLPLSPPQRRPISDYKWIEFSTWMPGKRGEQLLRAVQSRLHSPRVLFLLSQQLQLLLFLSMLFLLLLRLLLFLFLLSPLLLISISALVTQLQQPSFQLQFFLIPISASAPPTSLFPTTLTLILRVASLNTLFPIFCLRSPFLPKEGCRPN